MGAFFRLVAQHLILLTVLAFVLTGVLLRQQIFGLSGSQGPGSEVSAGTEASASAAPPVLSPAAPEAAQSGPAARDLPGESPGGPTAPPPGDTGALQAPSSPEQASTPEQEAPPVGVVPQPEVPGEGAAAASSHPVQVPQYLSGDPVTASGFTFRPLDPAEAPSAGPAVPGPETQPQPQPAAPTDAGPQVVSPVQPTGSGGEIPAAEPSAERFGVPRAESVVGAEDSAVPERLNAARRAFWEGEVERARDLYRALAREEPDNPDLLGELGNFYFQTGQREDAADAYATAAMQLRAQGRYSEAEALAETVRSLDPAKADQLSRRPGL